jgi:DNA-binding SARP family transcriptional activator
VTLDGDPLPTPRGYPAKLLALLVAANGAMTIDAAIEGLWPDADPDVGRNRLHGVILRLRRGLGLSVGGPIECADGVVRLDRSSHLEVDSWEFERLAVGADQRPEARAAAVDAYSGDVLSVQFAYDDNVAAYRRAVRRTFLRLATAMLADPPADACADALAAVARRAWNLAPDDDDVCLAAVRTLAGIGRHAEARELVESTARALGEIGVDSETFRRRGLLEAAR